MEIDTTPLELLQIVVEHQSIVRTKQDLINLSLSVLMLKTVPVFLIPAVQQ